MANLKEIRIRIASVKSTRKITSAMSRIAAARLRKAQMAMEAARDYGNRMAAVVAEVVGGLDDPREAHDLLEVRSTVKRVAIVAVTADRGLCGGFNANVNRTTGGLIREHLKEGHEVEVICVGKKSLGYLKAMGVEPVYSAEAPTNDTIVDTAKAVAIEVVHRFTDDHDKRVDEVHLVHNHFKNVITQEIKTPLLLPFTPAEIEDDADEDAQAPRDAVRELEPDVNGLLAHLLPVALETALQQAFFNSVAAEVAARRAAMDSATDNAGDLIDQLNLFYNRERQAAITKELMEITGGAEALKG